MEKHDLVINQAHAQALRNEREEESKKLKAILVAEADKNEKVRMARARLDAFQALYRLRTELSPEQEMALVGDALQALAAGQEASDAVRVYLRRRGEALARQALLTDFRLYWNALAAALGQRDKVIIDADKLPGRRHLWLVPFEPFRFPLPGMNQMPDRGSRGTSGGATGNP
jgi:hypothetical protein